MNSISEFVDKQTTSIFRNSEITETSNIFISKMGTQLPLFIAIILVGIIGYISYAYKEQTQFFIGSWLMYFHLGKNNEIHTTQIPENSNIKSILSSIVTNEEMQPF